MATLTVTAKGQITLKQELLRHLNVAPGQKVEVDKLPDGRLVVGAAPQSSIAEFSGILAGKEPPSSPSRRSRRLPKTPGRASDEDRRRYERSVARRAPRRPASGTDCRQMFWNTLNSSPYP